MSFRWPAVVLSVLLLSLSVVMPSLLIGLRLKSSLIDLVFLGGFEAVGTVGFW